MMQKAALQGGSAAEFTDWNFYKSTGGYTCHAPDNPKKRSACCPALLQSPPQNTTIAEFYARGGSCVTGCQTKMVLGFGCHQQMQVTPEHVKTACAMVLSCSPPRPFVLSASPSCGPTALRSSTLRSEERLLRPSC